MNTTLNANSASINGIRILTGKWDNHDIPNVIYISMNITATSEAIVDDILRDIASLKMCILYIYRKGYLNHLGIRNSWLMGTPEAITIFSLKYKQYIAASMDQKTMNNAMGILKNLLFQEPEYHLSYQLSLHHLATGQEVIIEPQRYTREATRGEWMPKDKRITVKL